MSLKFYLSRFAILLAYLCNRNGGHVLIISTLENIGTNLFKLRAVMKLFSYLVYVYPVVANFLALKLILIIQVKWNTNRFFVPVWGWFDPPLNLPCSSRSWNTDPWMCQLTKGNNEKSILFRGWGNSSGFCALILFWQARARQPTCHQLLKK